MSERRIVVAGLGTYNPWRNHHQDGADAHLMRGLIWYLKDNRNPGILTDIFRLNHPYHPRQGPVEISSPPSARDYGAELLAVAVRVMKRRPLALVPIPASKTTRATLGGRWPARELASRLERMGLGKVRICLAHRQETPESKGRQNKTEELAANLERLDLPGFGEQVVFIDDVMTKGEHLAAADRVLDWPLLTLAAVVGVDQAPGETPRPAYNVRAMVLTHDRDAAGNWTIETRDVPNLEAEL